MHDRRHVMRVAARDEAMDTMNVVRAGLLLMSAVAFGLMVL